jgi:hypothetical protein
MNSTTIGTRPTTRPAGGDGRPPGGADDTTSDPARPDHHPMLGRRLVVAVVVLVLAATAIVVLLTRHPSSAGAPMPTNAAMEQSLGIRVTRVALVGDGGLVQVNYLCLDPAKAAEFQSDTTHPPLLVSEDRGTRTSTVALMKKGHTMTAGQTYYFVYRNGGAVQKDEYASLSYGGMTLTRIPVL